MGASDWALLIGLLVNAVAVFAGMMIISRRVREVHDATNGLTEKLVAEVRQASLAAGEVIGARKQLERDHGDLR